MASPVVAVAVSGGRDSTALWHATARAAAEAGLQVVGLHVHHGLQPQADEWVTHLRRQSARWAARGLPVHLLWRRLQGAPARGDSIEAWARRERYAALAAMAAECGARIVLLAHHRRDQAETFLLQALRGAGPAGLAAMPRTAQRGGIVWARPWLDQPREAIESYLRRHRLRHVDDLSNADPRPARSRLRQTVLPVLEQHFPGAAERLAASARRAHEAAEALRELAVLDARETVGADGHLDRTAWARLSSARRANLLRAWLGPRTGDGLPETLVQRLLQELPQARSGSAWPWPAGQLRLHAGLLQAMTDAVSPPDAAPAHGRFIDLSRAGRVAVPEWRGFFDVRVVETDGIAASQLHPCELRARRGGEHFQRAPGTPPRSLKKQYQLAGVPAWQRSGPLLYGPDGLLFVPGLGVDARRLAARGVPMLALRWCQDTPPEKATPRG